MSGNSVQTHECMDLDKAKLMIKSNRLYNIYRDKQGAYSWFIVINKFVNESKQENSDAPKIKA